MFPPTSKVDVRAHVGAGATDLFGQAEGGWPQSTNTTAGSGQKGVLYLDLRVGSGSIRVRRWSLGDVVVPSPS